MIFKKDFLVFQLLLLADKNVFYWNLELISVCEFHYSGMTQI